MYISCAFLEVVSVVCDILFLWLIFRYLRRKKIQPGKLYCLFGSPVQRSGVVGIRSAIRQQDPHSRADKPGHGRVSQQEVH